MPMIEIFLKNRKPIKTKSYKFFTFEAGFIAKRVSHFAMRPGLRVAYRDLTESLQREELDRPVFGSCKGSFRRLIWRILASQRL